MADRDPPRASGGAPKPQERLDTEVAETTISETPFSPKSAETPAVAPSEPLDDEDEDTLFPSAAPTERPRLPRRPSLSPFADLLAEAGDPDAEELPQTLPSAPAAPPPRSDTVERLKVRRIGRYELLEELGSGGMAIVYKAVQPALDRLVAIKELRSEYLRDRQILARFEREATSLATLQHANIVHIHDFLREPDGAYIVMEYVHGLDLFDLLAEAKRLPCDVAAIIGLQLADGLEYAHYRGIVHRDVKPSNILVSFTGEVKVMDFGIAFDQEKSHLTQVGMAIGTPAYMAPEQIAGEEADFRADIFSFGIVLYELLTGEKPWGPEEDSRTITRRVLYEDPVSPLRHRSDLPEELVHLIMRCLNKEPEARWSSTHDLRRAIQRYVAREVPIDVRQRLVIFLKNRGHLTETEASSFVQRKLLRDPLYKNRDKQVTETPPLDFLRPMLIAGGVTLALVIGAALLSATIDYGVRLPDERPVPRLAP